MLPIIITQNIKLPGLFAINQRGNFIFYIAYFYIIFNLYRHIYATNYYTAFSEYIHIQS